VEDNDLDDERHGHAMTDSKGHANSRVESLVFGVPSQIVERSATLQ